MTEAEASVAERFGLTLKGRRRYAGLTQEGLAARSALTPQAISLIELGERRPYLESFVSLATALDIEPVVLLDGISWIPAREGVAGNYLVEPAPQQFFWPVGGRRPR